MNFDIDDLVRQFKDFSPGHCEIGSIELDHFDTGIIHNSDVLLPVDFGRHVEGTNEDVVRSLNAGLEHEDRFERARKRVDARFLEMLSEYSKTYTSASMWS